MHSVKVNSESMVNEITQRVVEHIRNEAAEAAEVRVTHAVQLSSHHEFMIPRQRWIQEFF